MKAFDTDALALLPDKTLTPEDEELDRKKARLAELEAQLADRELENEIHNPHPLAIE